MSKFCSKCGKELNDEAVVCTNCGCAVEGTTQPNPSNAVNDSPSAGYGVL